MPSRFQENKDNVKCKTRIFKIHENGCEFRRLMTFQTETETETKVYPQDVPWATGYDNICFHAVRYAMYDTLCLR